MKKIFLFVIALFCAEVALFAQNENFSLDLDSSHVEINAMAYREYNGVPQYVLMPTQHNGNVNLGDVFLITVDANTFTIISSLKLRGLQGVVINSIETSNSNAILFAGTQNNCGVFGALSASGSINWVKKDTSLRDVAAMELLIFGLNPNLLYIGSNHSSLFTTGNYDFAQDRTTYQTFADTDITPNEILIRSSHSASTSYGLILGKKSRDNFVLIAHNVSNGIPSQNGYVRCPLPANISWASDKGCLTAIAPNRYIAAIPIRNGVLQKDGILFVKFAFSATSGFSLVSNKVLYFPSSKVLLNDMVFINQPNENDVSVNVMGQYITTSLGQPFMVKIDTSFTTHEAFLYAGNYSDYLYRNFQLKRGVYNADNYVLTTAGSYQAYGSLYPRAGLYMTENQISEEWSLFSQCETPIVLTSANLSLRFYRLIAPTLSSRTLLNDVNSHRPINVRYGDFTQDCPNAKKYQSSRNVPKTALAEITLVHDNQQLSFKNLPAGCQYQIVNALGQELKKGRFTDETIGISDLYSGFYLVKITQNNQVAFTAKFVKL